MSKIIQQFVVLLAIFFGLWWGLSKIEYVSEKEVSQFSRDNQRRLGDLMIKSMRLSQTEIESSSLNAYLDTLKNTICNANGIPRDSITLHLFRNQEVNAFALPGNHIVIHTGLLTYAHNAEEVAGVMGHEIGHLQKKHIEKKLVKEVGISMLLVLGGGNGGQEILKQVLHTLSSTAFDRTYESEADMFAVEAMAKAGIDPENLSNFMYRMAKENAMPAELVWLSTHPDSKERAAEMLEAKKKYTVNPVPPLHVDWQKIKDKLNDY